MRLLIQFQINLYLVSSVQLEALLSDAHLFAVEYDCGAERWLLHWRLLHGHECEHHAERALHASHTALRRLFVVAHSGRSQLDTLHVDDTLCIPEYADSRVSRGTGY